MGGRKRIYLRTIGGWLVSVAVLELMRIQVALNDVTAAEYYTRSLRFQLSMSLLLLMTVYLSALGIVLIAEALYFVIVDRVEWNRRLRQTRWPAGAE